jgi:hypothetical protein
LLAPSKHLLVLKKRIYCLHVYLFFNWSLATLITQSVGRWDIHKVKFWRGVSLVSHIHFANYCFLFCKVNIIESNHLMTLLDTYGAQMNKKLICPSWRSSLAGIWVEWLKRTCLVLWECVIDGYMHIHWLIFYGGRRKKLLLGMWRIWWGGRLILCEVVHCQFNWRV